MKRLVPISLLALLVAVPAYSVQEEFRGIWVECEGSNSTLSSKQRIAAMLDTVANANFNAVIVQVYRGNRCWFDSSIGDTVPFDEVKKKDRIDPLQFTIDEGHKRGLQVHAWVNVFRIARNINAPMLKKLGPEIVMMDNKGRSFLDYNNFSLPKDEAKHITLSDETIMLDPANDKVQEYQLAVVKEIMTKYQKLDGIHLDFIRYPYTVPYSPGSRFAKTLQFGYTKAALKKFKEQTGLDPNSMVLNTKNTQAWDDFRREQMTRFVRSAYELCEKTSPRISVSAAALCWADRAYMAAFQDWRGWLEDGIVDFVVSMNYTKDRRLARYLSRTVIHASDTRCGYVGLQAYMHPVVPAEVVDQIVDCRKAGGRGIVIFSYDSLLKEQPGFFDILRKGLFSEKAGIPELR